MFLSFDIHIHSKYSIATSQLMSIDIFEKYGLEKGLDIIGTGDFLHPKYLEELKIKLTENSTNGFYNLNKKYATNNIYKQNFCKEKIINFIPSCEVSLIYKDNALTKKNHLLVICKNLQSAEKLSKKLCSLNYNINSDGRPILKVSSRDFIDICLSVSDEDFIIIPAHIWTPWFSTLGEKSGYNSIQECFKDLTPYIKVVETGLSSSPNMNRICTFLDDLTLISNSDAHSPDNIGRNATIIRMEEIHIDNFFQALRKESKNNYINGTIDTYPQTGKYFISGHRKCQSKSYIQKTCPICKKKFTKGVFNRIYDLSDKSRYENFNHNNPIKNSYFIIKLSQIISICQAKGEKSKTVVNIYNNLLESLGTELDILLKIPIKNIEKIDINIANIISKIRNNNINFSEGYDGIYGKMLLT